MGFELYYEQGRSGGYEYTEIKNNSNVDESFTESQRQQAFEIGVHHKLKDVGNTKYKGGTVDVFVNGYTGKNTVNSYARAFDIFYAEGVHTKKSFDAVMKEQGSLLSFIDEGVARKAFEEGRARLKEGAKTPVKGKPRKGGKYVSKTAVQEEIDTFFEALAGKLGADIERVQRMTDEKGREANAQIDLKTGKITTSASSINEYQSMIHEIVHYGYAYGNMAEVEKAVKDYFISLHGTSGLENVLRQYEKGYSDLDRAGVTEEFTADALAGMFSTDEGVNTFLDWLQNESGYSQTEKKTILEKLSEWIIEIVDAIKELLEGKELNDVVKSFAKKEIDRFGEIRGMFLEVLDKIEDVAGAEGVKSSLKSIPSEKDLDENIKEVASMQSVVSLTGNEFKKSEKGLVEQVVDYYESIGGEVVNSHGTIELTKKGVKSSLGHGIGRKKSAAYAAVPDVLKYGKIIDYQVNWKNRGYDTAVFAAPIEIADEKYYLAAVVVSETDKNSFYLHEVMLQEKRDDTLFKTGTVNNGTPSNVSSPLIILLKKIQDVKSSRKFSLDWVDFSNDELEERNGSLAKKNTELERINDELRAKIQHPGVKHTVSQLGVQKVARYLKSEYMSKLNIHKLSGVLGEFYSLLANGDGLSWDTVQTHLENIASEIISPTTTHKPTDFTIKSVGFNL